MHKLHMDDFRLNIRRTIKHYRKRSGLSQAALGRMLGVSAQQIQKYESGKDRISAEKFMAICFFTENMCDKQEDNMDILICDRVLLSLLKQRLTRSQGLNFSR